MDKIGVLSPSALYFAAPFLAKALDAKLHLGSNIPSDPYSTGVPSFLWGAGHRIHCDHIIVIGARALITYRKYLKDHKTAAVIFSDTNCLRLKKEWQHVANKNNVTVYAMPDLIPHINDIKGEVRPIYQCIQLPEVDQPFIKDRIVISHSPGPKLRIKGSRQIQDIINRLQEKYDFVYNEISGVSWEECVKQKSQSHIFIDQLIFGNESIDQEYWGDGIPYGGGIGKSGIEAMLCGCCVVTGAPRPEHNKYFPVPPVAWCEADTMEKQLEKFLLNPGLMNDLGELHRQWANCFCSPVFVAGHVTKHIRESS